MVATMEKAGTAAHDIPSVFLTVFQDWRKGDFLSMQNYLNNFN
jgi:hypothetical protein